MSNLFTPRGQFTRYSKWQILRGILACSSILMSLVATGAVKSPSGYKESNGEIHPAQLIAIIETDKRLVLIDEYPNGKTDENGNAELNQRALVFDRKAKVWTVVEPVKFFGGGDGVKGDWSFSAKIEGLPIPKSSQKVNLRFSVAADKLGLDAQTSSVAKTKIEQDGKKTNEVVLTVWREGVRGPMHARLWHSIKGMYTGDLDKKYIAKSDSPPEITPYVGTGKMGKAYADAMNETRNAFEPPTAPDQLQKPSLSSSKKNLSQETVKPLSLTYKSQEIECKDGDSCKKQNNANGQPQAYRGNGKIALSDIVDKALISTIRDLLEQSVFKDKIDALIKDLEHSAVGVDREELNTRNDIFLQWAIDDVVTEFVAKNQNQLIMRATQSGFTMLNGFSRSASAAKPKTYRTSDQLYRQFSPNLQDMFSKLADPEPSAFFMDKLIRLVNYQVSSYVKARSYRIRYLTKNSTIAEDQKKEVKATRVLEGTQVDSYINVRDLQGPGGKKGDSKNDGTDLLPIDVIIPDTPFEEAEAQSPNKMDKWVNEHKIKEGAIEFGKQTLLFNLPLMFVTLSQVGLDYAKNPMAITQFMEGLKDPATHAGFMAFIAANHKFSRFWREMTKPGMHFLGGYLGMAMGMTMSSLISSFWHDENIQKCAKSYMRDKAPCQSAYNTWVLTGKINELAPAIAGLISTAVASGVVGSGLAKANNAVWAGAAGTWNAVSNRVAQSRLKVKLGGMYVIPKAAVEAGKVKEILSWLKVAKGLVNTSLVTIGGNIVFLGVDPFISPHIESGFQKMKQSTFDLGQFLELSDWGDIENLGRFRLFGNVRMPHEMAVKTLSQSYSAMNESLDTFLDANFEPTDPRACFPNEEAPQGTVTVTQAKNTWNASYAGRINSSCFLYFMKEDSKFTIYSKQPTIIKMNGKEYPISFDPKSKKGTSAASEKPAPGKENDEAAETMSVETAMPGHFEVANRNRELRISYCYDGAGPKLLEASLPVGENILANPLFKNLKSCMINTNPNYWISKYSETQKSWRDTLLSEVTNAATQWSATVGDFWKMINATYSYYGDIIEWIWFYRFMKTTINDSDIKGFIDILPPEKEDWKKWALDIESYVKSTLKKSDMDKETFLKLARERIIYHFMSRARQTELLKSFEDSESPEGAADPLAEPTMEEQKLFPNHVGDFAVAKLNDYLAASLACGPSPSDPKRYSVAQTLFGWLPFESIAKFFPQTFSTSKLTKSESANIEIVPGLKFNFLPPRITTSDEACNSDNWAKQGKPTVAKVNTETKDSRFPVASIAETVLETLTDLVEGKTWDQKKKEITEPTTKSKNKGKNSWEDKSALIYGQIITIRGKEYRGIFDYLLENADNLIANPNNPVSSNFEYWWQQNVSIPLRDPQHGLWKDVSMNYENLINNHLWPVLTNNEAELTWFESGKLEVRELGDKVLEMIHNYHNPGEIYEANADIADDKKVDLYSTSFVQAHGVINSMIIEQITYIRTLRKIIERLGRLPTPENTTLLEDLAVAERQILGSISDFKVNVKTLDITEMKEKIDKFKESYQLLLIAGLKLNLFPQSSGGDINVQIIQKRRAAILSMVERIFGQMEKILAEVSEYKNYTTALSPDQEQNKGTRKEKPALKPHSPTARF